MYYALQVKTEGSLCISDLHYPPDKAEVYRLEANSGV